MKPYSAHLITLSAALSVASFQAVDAAGWRTDGTGLYPAAQPPLAWSQTSNVVWSTRLPTFSNASPLILGDRVFVCAEPDKLICLSLADGKMLWQQSTALKDVLPPEEAAKAVADAAKAKEMEGKLKLLKEDLKNAEVQAKADPQQPEAKTRVEAVKKEIGALDGQLQLVNKYAEPSTHAVNGYSSPTPATDGQNVYVLFGTGVAACYDLEGNRRWGRFIERPTHGWGHSASPVLAGNALLCHIMKMTALDRATGKVLWQVASKPAWGSPVVASVSGTELVVTAGGDMIRPTDGRVLAGGTSSLDYCAPLVEKGVVYFVQHGGKAIKLPPTADEPFKTEVLWLTSPKNDRYYASPVYREGLLYAVTQHGDFSVIDAADGRVVYEKKLDLGGTFYPSVSFAGGCVYISSDNGKTLLLKPGREYQEIARNTLEPFRSSPVFVGERMVVRTLQGVTCIGK